MPPKFQLVYNAPACVYDTQIFLSFSLSLFFSLLFPPSPPRKKERISKDFGLCVKIEEGRRLAGTCYAGANYRVGRAGCARIRGSGSRRANGLRGRPKRSIHTKGETNARGVVPRLPGQLTRAALIFNRV